MQSHQINEDFLSELLKACLTSKSILDIAIKHLQYHYIASETHKKIFERISQIYQLEGSLPTIGSLSQDFNKDEKVLRLLIKLKAINVAEKKDVLLQTFEKFLVNVKFIDLYNKIGTSWKEGNQDKAIKLLEVESPVIANFTIKDKYYTPVFSSFGQRQIARQNKERDKEGFHKVPFSIHGIDNRFKGGMNKGTSTLFMARSGGGKSTLAKWISASAARLGMRVFMFLGEDSEEENLDALDACWTSVPIEDIEFGFLPPEKVKLIEKANRDIIASGGEIYIKCAESFDGLYLNDCVDLIDDMEKIHGPADLIIFDSMENFPLRGKYYNSEAGERKRREDIANKITNIAKAKKAAVLATIQASDIKPELYNNPSFVLTRSHISEYKGAIKPFANFFTINQTDDEYENGIMRIFQDKSRKHKSRIMYKFCTALDTSRLYDAKKTLQMFPEK